MLAAMVQSGELPPLVERLPDDPLVLEPYEQTGTYGGELRAARTGPSDWGDMHRGRKAFCSGPTHAQRSDPVRRQGVRDLRRPDRAHHPPARGMKWSDGEPFTTADFMWVYDNVLSDFDIPASNRSRYTMGASSQAGRRSATTRWSSRSRLRSRSTV